MAPPLSLRICPAGASEQPPAPAVWSLFEQGELKADSELTGQFARDETQAEVEGVMAAIDDAREEAVRREIGREIATHNR